MTSASLNPPGTTEPVPAPPQSARKSARTLLVTALIIAAVAVAALLWTTNARSAAGAGAPADDSPEAGFARDMSTHHRQAVEMAFLILDRSDDPKVKLLATDILSTQQHQVGQMFAWLDLWGLPQAGFAAPMAWMDHSTDAPMPGMASQNELRNLAALSGVEADREFLRLMIRHHQGGAPMAEALLERSDDDIVTRLARAIVASQTAEIETMVTMLAERGGTPLPPPVIAHDAEHDE